MNAKLRLRVEDLRVEEFQTGPAAGSAGTVQGYEETERCTDAGCSQYCGDSMNANTAPCRFCPEMPITYSCDMTPCC